jgi:flagellar biogenesis protein FliO
MESTQAKVVQMEITQTHTPAKAPPFFIAAAACLKDLCRSALRRARGKRKTLAVRETAALGDRRFVSVIQFERQRFLVGSSPSSVTLLAQLPDECGSGEGSRKESGERN